MRFSSGRFECDRVEPLRNVRKCFKHLNILRQNPKSMNTVRPILTLERGTGKDVNNENETEGKLKSDGEHKRKEGKDEEGNSTDDDEDVTNDGMHVKIAKVENLPSQEEIDAHNAAHVPFRSWCPHCIKGKSKCGAHFKQRKVEHEVPTISLD